MSEKDKKIQKMFFLKMIPRKNKNVVLTTMPKNLREKSQNFSVQNPKLMKNI